MYDFKFKPFSEMTPEDYERVGFKSGLEIHQQLLTEKKLFCRCPAGIYSKEYNAEILRHMRPTLSELGEYDGTALMEFKTKKNITYRINYKTVCTYEMDDTPPFMMNDDALDIAVEVGMLLGAKTVDEVHIARKQYLDGSIPTGFQRTAITSVGGSIPYKDREIGIIQMSIEEDSCREFSDIGHDRVYLTDRLGMPLIETVTQPDMKTPTEVAEVNDLLRRLVRTTGKVRTGIGASRQDVNVSVTGGTRIEIKGVSRIPYIPALTYNEAMRQWNLLRLREELHKRGVTEETFEAKSDDITKLLKKTSYKPICDAIKGGAAAKCVTLRGFAGLLNWQTQTDTFFSKEISDRVRVIACLHSTPNIINSDSYENTLSSFEGQKIRKAVGAGSDDSLVIVWGSEEDAQTGASEIIIRAKEAAIGIPSETRQALPDGTNGFERILPGPERMYPDTDLPPIKLAPERVANIRAGLPDLLWDREAWYDEIGVPEDLKRDLAISKFAPTFKTAVKEWNIDPKLAAAALIQFPKRLKKMKRDVEKLGEEEFKSVFKALKEKKLAKDGVLSVLYKICETGAYSDELLPKLCSEEDIKKEIENAKIKLDGVKLHNPDKKTKALTGLVMDKLRGGTNGVAVERFIIDAEDGEK